MGLAEQMFAGMENAEGFGTGKYFEEGRFVVRVKSIKTIKSKNPKSLGVDFFIAETEIASSSNPEVQPGATRSYSVRIQGNQYAFADIKNFFFALALNIDPKNPPPIGNAAHAMATKLAMAAVDAEYLAKLQTTDPQLAAVVPALPGLLMNIETFKKPTRPTAQNPQGGMFTVHNWAPYSAPANGGAQ